MFESNKCFLCGAKISSAKYLTPMKKSCKECGKYCLDRCKEALNINTSWHTEPCITCEKNPYQRLHFWNGNEWVMKNV